MIQRMYLARHGQSSANLERRFAGQRDPGLSPAGVAQSHALATVLRDARLTAIYTSTLVRTTQMAEPTASMHGVPVHALEGLNELSLGALEGRFRDDRDPEAQALWQQRKANPADFRPPGGERFDELVTRVLRALDRILERSSGDVLVVGHRETNRALLVGLLGWSIDDALQAKLRNHLVYEIDVPGRAVVRTISLRDEDAGRSTPGFHT